MFQYEKRLFPPEVLFEVIFLKNNSSTFLVEIFFRKSFTQLFQMLTVKKKYGTINELPNSFWNFTDFSQITSLRKNSNEKLLCAKITAAHWPHFFKTEHWHVTYDISSRFPAKIFTCLKSAIGNEYGQSYQWRQQNDVTDVFHTF